VSSWIEKNILNNTGFVGRIRLNLRLEELPLKDTHAFWGANTKNISNEEKLKYISVTGSIPRYLEEIDARFSSEKNIERLAFNPSGILFNDFHSIFNDIFGTRSQKYKQIVSTLVSGPRSFEEICQKLKIEANGAITQYLQDLVEAGFLRRDYNFDFKGKKTKFSYFKLRDNYLRFYLKYIDPNHDKIKNQIVKDFSFESLINWPSILGLQFENTVLNNLNRVIELLKINSHEIISAGPYVQKKNAKNKGACQIDLLILTRFQTMYLCEIKFKKKVGTSIIAEVQKKINIFKRPKSFSIRPVLIYAGELEEEVTSSQFFNFTVSADDLMS
jgi:predicted transcriptional regulator